MQFKIGKLMITIEAVEESTRARRKMARRVDKLAHEKMLTEDPEWSLAYQRIRAYRELNYPKPGLKDSKDWVVASFADNGRGDIL